MTVSSTCEKNSPGWPLRLLPKLDVRPVPLPLSLSLFLVLPLGLPLSLVLVFVFSLVFVCLGFPKCFYCCCR
jgi:hypothetical protein